MLKIYDDARVKAEVLLDIILEEKDKRSEYTYEKLPQANKIPAQDSLKNADFFIKHMKELIRKSENQKELTPVFYFSHQRIKLFHPESLNDLLNFPLSFLNLTLVTIIK